MNDLAYIGKVMLVEPIENADRIERIDIVCGKGGKWSAVAQKGMFRVDDLCEVYLPDAIVPSDDPRFDFMSDRKYRVKIMRLRGVPSEALAMPLRDEFASESVGSDITMLARVEKYEKPLPAHLGGDAEGSFPGYIPKTDEPNFQRVPFLVAALGGLNFVATTKADGTSTTAYIDRDTGEFKVCSRNWCLKETERSAYWQVARAWDVEKSLRDNPNMALQWETVGPGIQKNPLGYPKLSMLLFDAYDFAKGDYIPYKDLYWFALDYGLPIVDLSSTGVFPLAADSEWLRKMAVRKYANGRNAEGIVVRPYEETLWVKGARLSFKVINENYRD